MIDAGLIVWLFQDVCHMLSSPRLFSLSLGCRYHFYLYTIGTVFWNNICIVVQHRSTLQATYSEVVSQIVEEAVVLQIRLQLQIRDLQVVARDIRHVSWVVLLISLSPSFESSEVMSAYFMNRRNRGEIQLNVRRCALTPLQQTDFLSCKHDPRQLWCFSCMMRRRDETERPEKQ